MREIQLRGRLTQRIKDKSMELLGYEMNVTELRLMPYVLYQMTNEQRIDPGKCSSDDRAILKKWRKAGYTDGGASGLHISEDFWKILCAIVFLGYVDID